MLSFIGNLEIVIDASSSHAQANGFVGCEMVSPCKFYALVFVLRSLAPYSTICLIILLPISNDMLNTFTKN